MVTQAEEQQAKEFLKRAEIRTMRKDLRALREGDALKERDKITKIKTLEEQKQEEQKKIQEKEKVLRAAEQAGMEKVLGEKAHQERLAEKNIKEYATEQERQQIFLLESERFNLEKKAEEIDKKKEPELKLQKNGLLIKIKEWESKLNSIIEEEKKFQGEEKFIEEKANTSNIPSEKKSLEQRRWDIEEQTKQVEKKRWEVEKQIEDIKAKVAEMDKSSDALNAERSDLRNKILGIDKSLRQIYSTVMARVEEKRSGEAEEQRKLKEGAAKVYSEKKETIQRQQWTGQQEKPKSFVEQAPAQFKEKLAKVGQAEEQERDKFLESIEKMSQQQKN